MIYQVYHGSSNDFNQFNYEFIGNNGTTEGKGFYFTDIKSIAEGYAKRQNQGILFTVNLNINKPLSYTDKKITKLQLKNFIKALDPTGENYLSNWGDVNWEGYNSILNEAVNSEFEGSDNDTDMITGILNADGQDYITFYTILKNVLGYDGIIIDEPDWGIDTQNGERKGQILYVGFLPEQIEIIEKEVF